MPTKQPCVYLLASCRKGTLYVGVTSDLVKRVWQHREGVVRGFSARYGIHRLVWYEQHSTMLSAITREKAIKGWRRAWKIQLIEATNPEWEDLYPSLF
jgi:putative endonuclease